MKYLTWIVGVFLVVGNVIAETASVREKLQAAAGTTGTNYFALRNALVASGTNALAELKQIVQTTNDLWRTRLMAGICLERIERGRDLQALIEKEWRTDPEYDHGWDYLNGGPGSGGLGALVAKRYKELGLWHYYLETIWKENQEHSRKIYMREDFWRAAARTSLLGSPQFELLVHVLAQRVNQDPGFKSYETILAFFCIKDARKPEYLSFLLENWLKWPESETPKREVLDQVLSMASAQDIPFLEGFERSHGQAMGRLAEVLRSCIAGLKQNQQKN